MLDEQTTIFEDELLMHHLKRAFEDRAVGHFRLTAFDRLIGGISPGRMISVAGEPSVSKTTFIGQLADDAASQGFISIVNTLEMASYQFVTKSIARISNGTVGLLDISQQTNTEAIEAAAQQYQKEIAPNMLYIEQPCTSVELSVLVSRIQRERKQPIILFVDYLQIMPSESNQRFADERLAIKEAVSGLRRIANRHDITVIAVSSVNRSNYGKTVTGLDALGGSAYIEYSADTVLFLSVEGMGEERTRNMALPMRPLVLTALKNRYAPTGSVKLELDCEHATFKERS